MYSHKQTNCKFSSVHCRSIRKEGNFLCTGWRPMVERVLNLDSAAIDQLNMIILRTVCSPLSFVYSSDLSKGKQNSPCSSVCVCFLLHTRRMSNLRC